MNFEIPVSIRAPLEKIITDSVKTSDLLMAAESISSRYRRNSAESKGNNFQLISYDEALSYVLARMPATYAAVARVLFELKIMLPNFSPQALLDVGAGPGTATLSACQYFDLKSSCLIEPNKFLCDVGEGIVSTFWKENIVSRWIKGDVAKVLSQIDENYDLVVLSYMLNELPNSQIIDHVKALWDLSVGVMVILEPGTPEGARIIGLIRDEVRRWGDKNSILAPCPHISECPLKTSEGVWCHFSVRTSRTKTHKFLKGGDTGFEDEKFSYLVLSRNTKFKRPDYRLIGRPSGSKVRELQVCGPNGSETLQVSKSHALYKRSKKLSWGDSFC